MTHPRIFPTHPSHPCNQTPLVVTQQSVDLVKDLESSCMALQQATDPGTIEAMYQRVQDARELLYRHIAACEIHAAHLAGEPKTTLRY